jgi:hypothetical protein
LLRQLAEPARDGKALKLREVLHADVASEAFESTLVDALLTARILIARTDAHGQLTVQLGHQLLKIYWSRCDDSSRRSKSAAALLVARGMVRYSVCARRLPTKARLSALLRGPGMPASEDHSPARARKVAHLVPWLHDLFTSP